MTTPAPIGLPGLPTTTDPTPVIAQMLRRASSPGFETWWRRAESVGFCAHPIQLVGAGSIGRRQVVLDALQQQAISGLPVMLGPVRP